VLKVRGLDHAGIPVGDLARSLRFYEHVFGVTPDYETEYGAPALAPYLRLAEPRARIAAVTLAPGVTLELLEYLTPVPAPYSLRDSDVGATHLCLEVDDIEAAYRELRAKGVDVYAAPYLETEPGPFAGSRWLFFKDPDGVTFELTQVATDEGG
jgi:catechol 2,3-dioxygenase-like lactoylglutathione lyase family enzyme